MSFLSKLHHVAATVEGYLPPVTHKQREKLQKMRELGVKFKPGTVVGITVFGGQLSATKALLVAVDGEMAVVANSDEPLTWYYTHLSNIETGAAHTLRSSDPWTIDDWNSLRQKAGF